MLLRPVRTDAKNLRISGGAWLAANVIEYYSKEGPVALYGQTSAGIGIGMLWTRDDWVGYQPKDSQLIAVVATPNGVVIGKSPNISE